MLSLLYKIIWLIEFLSPIWILFGFILIGLLLYKNPKIMCIFLIIYCGFISYFFEPTMYDDLYRYHEFIDRYREIGWSGVSKLYTTNYWFSTSLLYQFLLYGLSFINNNYLATTLITLLTYSLIGVLNFRISNDYKMTKSVQSFILISQFIAIDLYSTVSSWLYMLTLAILANLIYTDLVKKKHRITCFVLYFLLGSLHTISYTILLLRILIMIPRKKIINILSIILLFWRALITPISNYLQQYSGNPYMQRILGNMEAYSKGRDNSNIIYMLSLILMVGVIYFIIVRTTKIKVQSHNQLDSFLKLLIAIVIGAFGSTNLMFRYTHFIIMFVPLYLAIIKNGNEFSFRRLNRMEFMYILATVGLSIYYIQISYRLLI